MAELREFDNSIGRCCHCGKLIFREDEWIIPDPFVGSYRIAHRKCDNEYIGRASQM